MDDEERELILKAKEGDAWAFETLVSRYNRLFPRLKTAPNVLRGVNHVDEGSLDLLK